MVVFDNPVGVSVVGGTDPRSLRGDEGRDDNGIGAWDFFAMSKGGRNVSICMTRYPVTSDNPTAR
jgi:hypothetical protein